MLFYWSLSRNQTQPNLTYTMKRLYIVIAFLAGVFVSVAQQKQIKKATEQYQNLEYINAISTYEKVVQRGYKTYDMVRHLGNAYYFNAQYPEAAKWYTEMFKMQATVEDPEYYLRYSISLKAIEDYDEANEYLEKYYKVRGAAKPNLDTYLDVIEENSVRYEVESVEGLNSELSDYGTIFYKGQLIFTSTRFVPGKSDTKPMAWNNQPYSGLYAAQVDTTNTVGEIKLFSENLDSQYNEATPVFTNDGKTVYFTRNNYLKKRGFNKDNTTLLKIYKAKLVNGEWTNIEELPFNNDEYSVAHPALSPDNKTLYFASDMPGTIGDADIWKVEIKEDGTYGKPVNLGPTVNTEGRESFPFVSDKNELYYSSTGKLGLGGLDIFVSKITEDGEYEEAVNMAKPINSPMDDFAFYIDEKAKVGYFTSNREESIGDDDIFKFYKIVTPPCENLIFGVITDIQTKEPLEGAQVSLYDENQNLIATTTSDAEGKYSFEKSNAGCDKVYRVRAEKEHYTIEEKFIRTGKESGEVQVNLALKKIAELPEVGKALNDLLDIPVLYFDFNKWDIRPDAEIEIAKVLQVMEDYPNLEIEIGSHSDSRGSDSYNLKLSDKRAKSTREWLVKNGIAPHRVTAKGYGETQLVNHCEDGVECTEEEHQLNRRSLFVITSVGK
jgi:outer membrane protein OmpA-like peptidoglycan-associated protein